MEEIRLEVRLDNKWLDAFIKALDFVKKRKRERTACIWQRNYGHSAGEDWYVSSVGDTFVHAWI